MECLQLRKPIQTGRREDFQVVKQIKDGVVNKTDLQKINHKKSETVIFLAQVHSFIHSFIHSGVLYSASSRDFYSEALPAQSRTKKKDFREMSNLEGWAISKERNSKGRSFHADGPTTEKALRCIIAKRARGTKNRTQHPTCGQNRHWAAEVAEVRGGAAKDTTGDHCSDTILYSLKYRQPME